ncbi:MAG: RteC domain-containing protein [Pedobacter sp.]|nr:RteC domain-containing protein [Pedobacter sp.]
MKKRCEALLKKLQTAVDQVQASDSPMIEKYKDTLALSNSSLVELRAIVEENGFASVEEEIWFFKEIKPIFGSFMTLAAEWYGFEQGRPAGRGKRLAKYLAGELDYIDRFFSRHRFMYEYFRSGATELDPVYFVRGSEVSVAINADIPAFDSSFATSGDYLFSRFIALEKLRSMVMLELESPFAAGAGLVKSKKGKELRWTGDSCNLIELVYGIFDCKQVNDGDVDLSDLMDVFEQCFQINLSRYFRRFTEIKRRKSMSKTRFLDEMARVVNKRIEDGDAYVPMSMR